MAKVKRLTVSLENQPGRLAAVAKVLADAKVNIEAVLAATAGAQSSAQLVVDNVTKAKKALSAAQFVYTEGTLDRVELPNKAGALADFAAKLAKNGLNIDTAYGILPKGARKSVLLLATSKPGGG